MHVLFSYKTQRMNDPYWQCTMDPTQHPGFQQQPVPGSSIGSMYPLPLPLGCPLPPPPGYHLLLPLPLPPGVTIQQQYQPVLPPYPLVPPQGYSQYLPYLGWGLYGTPYFHALPTPMPNTMAPLHNASVGQLSLLIPPLTSRTASHDALTWTLTP